jgi:hypothetical protein
VSEDRFIVGIGFEEKILAFNITGFAQCFAQLCPKGIDISIAYDERTNSIHLHLLRTRRERPRSRAAEQRDEIAPFQLIEFPRFNISGSLAMFDATRLASSIVICFASMASASVERP